MCTSTLILFSTLVLFSSLRSSVAGHPNVVVILADDLGWDDVSLHGSPEIPTPNIDLLATDGILLNNYYVQPICTPSRAALMTGRHPVHLGLQHDVLNMAAPYGLGLNETLLPQYLKTLGYSTHMVGKWHLGFFDQEHTPTKRGFASHLGYYQGCEDYYDHTYGFNKENWGLDFWRNFEVDRSAFGQYSTEVFTSEAERVIAEHDVTKPLFLYLAQQAVHSGNSGNPVRLQAPWKYVKNFMGIQSEERRVFAGMVSALDDSVGNVTKALHRKGILNDTIVIFSTDNGGPANRQDYNDACNWPLRGSKRTMWEGGVRGNGFIWSPLLEKSGYVSEHLMQIIDWVPTILEAVGYDVSKLPSSLDGVSQWKALSHHEPSPRKELLHNIDPINGDGALRTTDMKVVFGGGDTKRYPGWYKPEEISIRSPSKRETNQEPGTSIAYKTAEIKSDLMQVFRDIGLNPSQKTVQVVVHCGEIPANASTACKPWVKPCLFNITADPCEYYNIADEHQSILHDLLDKVQEYNRTAVPPLNVPNDPKGFPINHDGVWRPWK